MNRHHPHRLFHFLLRGLLRLLGLTAAVAVVLLSLFLFIRFTEKTRAISIESPENPAPPPLRAPESLRFATYNIAHGRGGALGARNTDGGTREEKIARLESIGERLGQLGLDIIALQEVDFNTWWSHGVDQAEVIARAAGFPYIVRQRNLDTGLPLLRRYDFGNALLSRFPVVDAERIEFPAYRDWERMLAGNHDGLQARIRIGQDRDILVMAVHLEVRSEVTRVQAAGELIRRQRATTLPVVVLGDLNSTPPGFPMAQVTPSGQNTIEMLESFGGFQRRPARGQATWHDFTFPTEAPRRIIDWILPDRNWTFLEYRVLREFTDSDHFPVMATLRLR